MLVGSISVCQTRDPTTRIDLSLIKRGSGVKETTSSNLMKGGEKKEKLYIFLDRVV